MRHVTRLRAFAAAGAALLATAGGGAVATAATAPVNPGAARVSLAGTHPALATAHALQSAAPALPARITASIYLASPDEAGLTAYAQAVSTPGSALYGHYLTAAQVIARYAPSASQAQAVKAWAASNGLSVGTVTAGFGAYVQVSGAPSVVAHAFGVKFGSYQVRVKKAVQKFWAPEQAASVPASLASDVLAVAGLDSANHQMKPDDTLPPAPQNYFVAPWTSSYYGQKTTAGLWSMVHGTTTVVPPVNGKAQPWTVRGYTPAQIRGAYNVAKSGETGKGVTVAVIDAYASPTMLQDANLYAAATGDKGFAPGQYKQVLHPGAATWDSTDACGASGWYGEESLDVESVHGMAPDAKVTYIGASDCFDAGLGNALAYVVNTHAASIVTNSWGEPSDTSSLTPVYDLIFKAGAAEGIGFFFSSGDSGYEDPNYQDATDQVQVDYPTSSPWVTSVGGTSLAIGAQRNYQFETGWGTILDPLTSSNGTSSWALPPTDTADQILNGLWDGSSGGGVANDYAQPWYQKAVVPAKLARTEVTSTPLFASDGTTLLGFNEAVTTASSARRVIPDVAALADPSTGIAVGETLFGPDGKTEKFYISRIGGTSVACPIFAGIEADAQQANGRAIGFANPAIYTLDALNTITRAFSDVVDHPHGQNLYEVRSNYTDPNTATGPLLTYLRRLGVNGFTGVLNIPATPATSTTPAIPAFSLTVASALQALRGYDDETGVGSPSFYIQAFQHHDI